MTLPNAPLWPAEYNVDPDHCGDVLRGAYDVPFDPEKPPVVLDIGANVGAFARWATTRWPGCEIHSYEPHPQVTELLHRTIATHSLFVQTHQCAVSNKDDETLLYDGPNNIGESSIVFNHHTTARKVHVLDAAKLPFANILKIDAEGSEINILQRLHEVNRLSSFSAVMLETHDPNDRKEIMALLEIEGFTLTKDHIWARGTGIKYCDPNRSELCYVRKDLIPEGFKPEVKDTSTKPLVWIATPLRSLEANGILREEDVSKLPEHYKAPLKILFNSAKAGLLPWDFELCLVGGGGVARARNRIVTNFLQSRAEFLFFLDLDLMPSPEDFVTILSRMTGNKLPVCGGLYTIRQKGGHWVLNYPDAGGAQHGWALPVMELGTGFKCYHRSALEFILKKNPWLICENDDTKTVEYGFFSMGPVKDDVLWPGRYRWLTEDYWLDWLTRDAGLMIVVDVNVKIRHYDEATGQVFPTDFPEVPQPMSEEDKVAGKFTKIEPRRIGG